MWSLQAGLPAFFNDAPGWLLVDGAPAVPASEAPPTIIGFFGVGSHKAHFYAIGIPRPNPTKLHRY